MKKIFVFLLSFFIMTGLAVAASAAELSPAISVLRAGATTVKTCVGENPVSFTADEFENLAGQKVSAIKVVSLPNELLGTLTLDGEPTSEGQTIPIGAVRRLCFVPTAEFSAAESAETVFEVLGENRTFTIRPSAALNFAPSARGAAAFCVAGVEVHSMLCAEDPEGDALTYRISSYPRYGTVTLNAETGAFAYTPDEGHVGSDSFWFVAADGYGNVSAPAKVTVKTAMNKAGVVYEDMTGNAAHLAAVKMAETDVMVGEKIGEKQYFYPEREVSRADFLVMAMNAAKISPNAGAATDFLDDGDMTPYQRSYVASAKEKGIVLGIETENGFVFEPRRTVTLAEAELICSRIAACLENGACGVPASVELNASNGNAEYVNRETAAVILYEFIT